MIIRDLKLSDLQGVIAYGIAQKERTIYGGMEHSYPMIAYGFRKALSSANDQCFVVDDDGKIRGFILLTTIPYWWADPRTGPRYATDLALFSSVPGGGYSLLRTAIDWARTRPRVQEFTSLHSSGIHLEQSVDKVYQAAGMKRLGRAYIIDFRKEKDHEQSDKRHQENP